MMHPSRESSSAHFTEAAELAMQVDKIENKPGVYQFKNDQGTILYVGKARDLKKRVQSYFQTGRPHDPKTRVMLSRVAVVETIVTRTEKEALILESNLIKRHRPRYNVVLKDDKRYPSIRLNLQQAYPNLNIVRKLQNDGALYFGPYASSAAVRQTIKFIHKTFKLRKCRTKTFMNRTRPCLNYQMGLCLGPCCLDVDEKVYRAIVDEVIAFLRGRTPALVKQIKKDMEAAAKRKAYEKAAVMRDKMFALEKTLEKQVCVISDFKDRDIIGLEQDDNAAAIILLRVRGGFLLGQRQYLFESAAGAPEAKMTNFLQQLYDEQREIPPEILVSHLPGEKILMEAFLSDRRGKRVTLTRPQRGEKVNLVRMAKQNARRALREMAHSAALNLALIERLQRSLQMEKLPRRIECFDNSNLYGTNQVAAMVVFKDARPYPSEYRRYKIRAGARHDDYAMMAEVLQRRYAKKDVGMPYPDLLLLDGGKGQLNIALAVLDQMGLTGQFTVAAIAKKDATVGETTDKIYLPGRSNPVQFGRQADLLLFLQRVRDETHRAAITYQRKKRKAHALSSALDAINGVGPQRKKILLHHFGSVERIGKASLEELAGRPGISIDLARRIRAGLLNKK
jgi:excinuclease ABC subunit C